MLARVTRAGALRVRHCLHRRQTLGPDRIARRRAIPTRADARRSLPLLESRYDRPLDRARNADSQRPCAAQLLDDHRRAGAALRRRFDLQRPRWWRLLCLSSSSGDGNGDGHVTQKHPWAKWGPVATRVIPNNYGARLPKPAGPFWITGFSPLVIRDYGTLRAWCAQFLAEEEDDRSTSLFGPRVFESTEVLGEHWKTGKLETCLPYRDLVAKNLDYIGVVADREWIIGISVKLRLF
jgi:hypothetical protein